MNPKYLQTLEFDKIVTRLADYAAFSAGRELALALSPSSEVEEVLTKQKETAEAKALLSVQPGLSVGGARDVRPFLTSAEVGAMLDPQALQDIKGTLLAGKSLRRAVTSHAETYPLLTAVARELDECPKLVAEISRCISERGEILDSASPTLARIRRELASARDRMMDRLNRLITSSANVSYLQENLVTQRSGRYVIPLKAEFRGRIPGIVHDQSASGATIFVEPLAVVEAGNHLRELQLAEQQEIERILRMLSTEVAAHSTSIRISVEALAQLDLAFAKALYAFDMSATEPVLLDLDEMPAQDSEADRAPYPRYLRLERARHPLLPPETVVPLDVHLGGDFLALIITGPNTGGKTVALKTVGLLAAMAQSGLQWPAAEGSALRVFSGIYADIGDEQSIEQSLSTFSSHMTNIVTILGLADSGSLVLLDELGAGTDPTEGSALGQAILTELLERRIPAMVTTHYNELKLFAQASPGVENASVEFDVATLTPTFRLTVGLPGRSNAFAIAKRLGLPEHIIDGARSLISMEDLQAERVLDRIRHTRHEMGRATHAAQLALASAREREKQALRMLRETEQERKQLLGEAHDQLEAAQQELQRIKRTVERQKLTQQWLEDAVQTVGELERRQQSIAPPSPKVPERAARLQEPLRPGDTVWVASLDQIGQIISMNSTEAEVQVGFFRAKVPLLGLERRPPSVSPTSDTAVSIALSPRPIPTVEIMLRGLRVDEALSRLHRYLDDAYLAQLPYARIVHGKGTGTLRQVVREVLAEHPLVASFRPGELNEGGEGVTVVKFAPRASA